MDWKLIFVQAQELALAYGLKIIYAILIFVFGRFLIKLLIKGLRKVLVRSKLDPTLTIFCLNLAYFSLLVFVAIAALGQIGIQTTSIVAVLGAAGLAIGLALQGSLSNFASGILIIILKPFKLGDFIDGGGASGIVQNIGMINTSLLTPDNKLISIPNSNIMGGAVTNFSAENQRRMDLVIGVGYDDDIRKVEKVLCHILDNEERILKEPAYRVGVLELADSSVNFAVRPWVKTSEYWDVYFDLMKQIKLVLDANGITIPYPQRDIHLHQDKPENQD